jgi:hypothetical protein
MPDLSTILSIPLLQAVGLVLLIGLAERVGIPIISWIKNIMNISGNTQVDRLSNYYNHDLTDQLTSIRQGQEKDREASRSMHDTMKNIENSLANMDKYGIKCRHD